MSLVAITLTPVPAAFSISISPRFFGAITTVRLISFITSNIFSFGTSDAVLQEILSLSPPVIAMVDVTILVGFVTSLRA